MSTSISEFVLFLLNYCITFFVDLSPEVTFIDLTSTAHDNENTALMPEDNETCIPDGDTKKCTVKNRIWDQQRHTSNQQSDNFGCYSDPDESSYIIDKQCSYPYQRKANGKQKSNLDELYIVNDDYDSNPDDLHFITDDDTDADDADNVRENQQCYEITIVIDSEEETVQDMTTPRPKGVQSLDRIAKDEVI